MVAEQLVHCLGLRWDAADWEALGSSIGHFRWTAFLAVLEAKYCADQQLHTEALVEAVDELYDVFIEDIIKKVMQGFFLTEIGLRMMKIMPDGSWQPIMRSRLKRTCL